VRRYKGNGKDYVKGVVKLQWSCGVKKADRCVPKGTGRSGLYTVKC